MAKTLRLQLSDELEQKLSAQAARLNLSVEELALDSLAQTVTTQPVEQMLQAANQLVVLEFFGRVRQAKQAGQRQVEVPATDLTRQIVETMVQLGQVVGVSPSATHPQTQLVLALSTSRDADESLDRAIAQSLPTDLPPEIAPLLQSLDSTPAETSDAVSDRLQRLKTLLSAYREQP